MMADGGFELGSSGSATDVFSITLRPPLQKYKFLFLDSKL